MKLPVKKHEHLDDRFFMFDVILQILRRCRFIPFNATAGEQLLSCCDYSLSVTPHFPLLPVLCRAEEVTLTGACLGMRVAGPLSSRGRPRDHRLVPTIQWWTAGLTVRSRYGGQIWQFGSFLFQRICPWDIKWISAAARCLCEKSSLS